VVPDHEGVECADNKAACGAATKALLDLASGIADRTSSCELSIEEATKQRSQFVG
jgi:hypothetical protein